MSIPSNPPISEESVFRSELALIERALERFLPSAAHQPPKLHEAMRYSVLNGGKRFRPLLVLSACEMLGGDMAQALVPACAVELIHAYSLIHDDLPCMDNADTRRGRPACHKKFGEATALLAGDALLTLAFHVLCELKDGGIQSRLSAELSRAAGTFGMIGGQAMELALEGKETDLLTLESIHIHKTGQLIKASCLMGAVTARADSEAEQRIVKYGEYLGFAFQITDDILDGDGFLRFMSIHEAHDKARETIQKAKEAIRPFAKNAKLIQLADSVLNRGK